MSSGCEFHFSYSATDAKRLLFFLLGFEVLLVSAYILTHIVAPDIRSWVHLPTFFNIDREATIPNWFSFIQLFAMGLLLTMQAPSAKQLRNALGILGCGFLFLSMDEAAAIHERLSSDAIRALNLTWLKEIEYLAWMVPYVCIGAIGLVTGYRSALFAWRNFHRESVLVVTGCVLFVIGGMALDAYSRFRFTVAPDEHFLLTVAAEEMFEMVGASIMFYGFMLLGIGIQTQATVQRPVRN